MGETTDLSLVEVGFLRPQTGVESQGGNETPPNGSRDSCLQKKVQLLHCPGIFHCHMKSYSCFKKWDFGGHGWLYDVNHF